MYAAQPATCGLRGAVAQGRLRRPGPHRPRVYKSGSDQCWTGSARAERQVVSP